MEPEEKRKRFFPTVTLGQAIATITFIASAAGIYTQLYAQVNTSQIEINNIKVNEIKREVAEKDMKQELKQEVRDVKQEIRDLNLKVDRVLEALAKQQERINR